MDKEPKPIVYIPAGAKINSENKNEPPPATRYDKRRVTFDMNRVKKIVGGEYGRKDS